MTTTPPTAIAGEISIADEPTYVFDISDFAFTDPDHGGDNDLASVTILSTPDHGTLTFDGVVVIAEQIAQGLVVSAADIAAGKLTFTPGEGEFGDNYASFSYSLATTGYEPPLAAWTFQNSGDDSGPGDHDVTLFGGAHYDVGLSGQGVRLDGEPGSFIRQTVNDGAFDFGANDFSVQLWVKFDDFTHEQTLIEDFTSGGGPGWTLTLQSDSTLQFYSDAFQLSASIDSVNDGEWHQFSFTRSGMDITLYVDGVAVATGTAEGAIFGSSNALLIGARNDEDGRNFAVNGVIDNVGIWDRAIGADEVADNWNFGDGTDAPGDVLSSDPTTVTIDVGAVYQMADGGDSLTYAPGADYRFIRGGNGVDTVTFDLAGTGVAVSADGPAFDVDIGRDGDGDLAVSAVEKLVFKASSLVLTGDLTAAGVTTDPRGVTYNGDGTANLFDARGVISLQSFDVNGMAGLDTLYGGGAADTLNGGGGADSMEGGRGADFYVVDNLGDVVKETAFANEIDTVQSFVDFTLGANIENLVLTGAAILGVGNAGKNAITGNAQANMLEGRDGADTLNGDAGADTMKGGAGNDSYLVDQLGDVVVEEDGGGALDSVRALVDDYTLSAFVENLTLAGAALKGTGNAAANLIVGSGLNNTLFGLDGLDTLRGAGGADSLDGGLGDDRLYGGAGLDTLLGGRGADIFIAEKPSDFSAGEVYDGGVGDDVIQSLGAGLVDLSTMTLTSIEGLSGFSGGVKLTAEQLDGTKTLEVGGAVRLTTGGVVDLFDRAIATSTFILSNEDTTLILGRSVAPGGTGFSITGGDGDDDIEYGGSRGGHISGAGGSDTLTGGKGRDELIGGEDRDYLDGAGGADTMTGGSGGDNYYVDRANDIIVEDFDGGTIDTVNASISWTLGSNLENIQLLGNKDLGGYGNNISNLIAGNDGSNRVFGFDGSDFLFGEGGRDTLDGGADGDTLYTDLDGDRLIGGDGGDTFYFDTSAPTSIVTIVDFSGRQDFSGGAGERDNIQFPPSYGALDYIGAAAFSSTGGFEIRFAGGFLECDFDGDGARDFRIHMLGMTSAAQLTQDDFVT